MDNQNIKVEILENVILLLKKKSLKLVTVESCTGGLLSSTITSISGSSEIFDYGLVTYSNSSKINLLNVSPTSLKKYGAVSEEISEEMISKLSNNFNTNIIYISITGLAGPEGGSNTKPIGTVFISIKINNKIKKYNLKLKNNGRQNIQKKIVNKVLEELYKLLINFKTKSFLD